MTQQERLDKFKTTYKPREGFTLLIALTEEEKFLGVVYKKVEIVSSRFKTREVAEAHIFYVKDADMKVFIRQLDKYIEQAEVLQLS